MVDLVPAAAADLDRLDPMVLATARDAKRQPGDECVVRTFTLGDDDMGEAWVRGKATEYTARQRGYLNTWDRQFGEGCGPDGDRIKRYHVGVRLRRNENALYIFVSYHPEGVKKRGA